MESTKCRKGLVWLIAAITGILLSMFIHMPLLASAAAETPQTVHLIIENTKFNEANAPWTGTLLDTDIPLTNETNALELVKKAAEANNISLELNADGTYITGINGLKEKDGGEQSGWMATVNDIFGNVGLNEAPIKAGDEIRVMHSMAGGNDLRIRVAIENNTFKDAPWTNELINSGVLATEGMTALNAVQKVAEANNIDLALNEDGTYITGINGLKQKDGGPQSGWTATVNDVFGNIGLNETPANAGDEIRVMYSTQSGDLQANVVIENNTFKNAPWTDELLSIRVHPTDTATALQLIEKAVKAFGKTITIADNSYITEIDGLKEKDGGEQSGWMATVNDIFGNVGLNETSIKAGDEIHVMYSMAGGNDLSIRVAIENNTFKDAPWIDELINNGVLASEGMTALEAVQKVAEANNIDVALNEGGTYITGINGLKQKDGGPQSGWTATVNDVFGNVGLKDTPANAGDEIRIMYSAQSGDLQANVVIENNTFKNAPWTDELLSIRVHPTDTTTALQLIEKAIKASGKTITIADNSYITEIDGLKEKAGGAQSGWMAAVNDIFGNVGLNKTSVNVGDEIHVMYSMGNDLRVNVSVENNTYKKAPWTGQLFSIGVYPSADSTALEMVEKAVKGSGKTITIANNYITEINGLKEKDGGAQSGWMGKVNDRFGDVGLDATKVKPGDSIQMLYTQARGNDLGTKTQKLTNKITGTKTKVVGDKLTQKITKGAKTKVQYSSSNKNVATVNASSGVITCKGVGVTTITSTAAGSREYKKATASFTLTVKPQAVGVKSITFNKKGEAIVKSNGKAKSYCDGYQIQYRQGKKGKITTLKVKNKNKKALSAKISKLKPGKTYQVRIRAYKKVGKKTYTGKYGAWKTAKKPK